MRQGALLMTGMVVNVAVSVVVVAAIARTAEHRAGPSCHRAYRAADHCSDRTADRRARDDAAGRAHGLRWGVAQAPSARHPNATKTILFIP